MSDDKNPRKNVFRLEDLRVTDFDTLPELEDVSGGCGDTTPPPIEPPPIEPPGTWPEECAYTCAVTC